MKTHPQISKSKARVKKIQRTISRLPRWLRAHTKSPLLLAFLVFVATYAAFFYYWGNVRAGVQRDKETAYRRQERGILASTAGRVQLYENFARGGAGLFALDNALSQSEWASYFDPYEIPKKYPDIQGLGFYRYVTGDEAPMFLESMVAQGQTGFTITPAGDRAVYVPVTYAARFNNGNGRPSGYDVYTDPVRRKALERAIRTGQPSMTGQINLSTFNDSQRPGFVIYLPVYKPGMPLGSPAERKSAIYGFTTVGVDTAELFSNLESENPNDSFAMKLVDSENPTGNNPAAYTSRNFQSVKDQKGSIVHTTPLELYGHRWDATFAGSPGLISSSERQLPSQTLYRGLFTSIFFAGLVWYLITYRERRLSRLKHQEVQTAKDDLLSLASHQLRTPATVVKQYVGMLLQGYGGELTKQQMDMLGSAYESNERQLDIINQLLYVARLDAGRITLRKESVDMSRLLKSVVRDQAEASDERHQTVRLKLPKKPLRAVVDPRYLRMVLENLLSNAIKYTPEGGAVTISLQDQEDIVIISVKDNGVGIGSRDIPTVFDKFTRIENDLSNEVNGSGVGLYLTREIVTLHDGTIEVTSQLGQGSVFVVTLPKGQPGKRKPK